MKTVIEYLGEIIVILLAVGTFSAFFVSFIYQLL